MKLKSLKKLLFLNLFSIKINYFLYIRYIMSEDTIPDNKIIDISRFYDMYKTSANEDGTINVPCNIKISQTDGSYISPDNENGTCVIKQNKLVTYSTNSEVKCAKSFTGFTKKITMNIGSSVVDTQDFNVCAKNCIDGSPMQLISPSNTYPICKYKATVNYSWPIKDENPMNITCIGGTYVTDELKDKINNVFPNFIDADEKLMCMGRPSEYTVSYNKI